MTTMLLLLLRCLLFLLRLLSASQACEPLSRRIVATIVDAFDENCLLAMPNSPDTDAERSRDLASGAAGEVLRIGPTLEIPLVELVWQYTASGGPGGQHANTANTKATVVFDVALSPSLTEFQRERIVAACGVEIRISVSDERSQLRNKRIALDRLRDRIRDALTVLPVRRPTRPSKAAQARRLQSKARTAERKSGRRTRYSRDD